MLTEGVKKTTPPYGHPSAEGNYGLVKPLISPCGGGGQNITSQGRYIYLESHMDDKLALNSEAPDCRHPLLC